VKLNHLVLLWKMSQGLNAVAVLETGWCAEFIQACQAWQRTAAATASMP
jgi:hypothetical protein